MSESINEASAIPDLTRLRQLIAENTDPSKRWRIGWEIEQWSELLDYVDVVVAEQASANERAAACTIREETLATKHKALKRLYEQCAEQRSMWFKAAKETARRAAHQPEGSDRGALGEGA